MGPAASAEFVNRLVAQTPAGCDQEHIPFVLWNNPQIPDRSTSLRNEDDRPLPFLLEGIQILKAARRGSEKYDVERRLPHRELPRRHVKLLPALGRPATLP